MSLYLGNNLIAPNQSNAANKSLSNLDATGEKHFVNKNQITNCILEAPNGVATYTTTSITIKAGVKVLFSNGRNADGTLKNIEYTFEEDTTFNISSGANARRFLVLEYDNPIRLKARRTNEFIVGNSYPSTISLNANCVLYNPVTNIFSHYDTDSTSWIDVPCAVIGIATMASNTYTDAEFNEPIDILKRTDSNEISGYGMPSNKNIAITVGAAGTQYTAPANGWFSFSTNSGSTSVGYVYLNNATTGVYSYNMGNAGVNIQGSVPAKKGDKVSLWWTGTNLSITAFRFIYAKGSESEAS